MSATGGDILEITYNHEDFGSGAIFCKTNEDGTVDYGGYRSNDDANMISGDGQMIDQINRVRWSFEAPPIIWDMTDADEVDQLVKMAASPKLGDWTINHISGKIWGGKGKPVGDIQGTTNAANVTLKLAGPNKLKSLS